MFNQLVKFQSSESEVLMLPSGFDTISNDSFFGCQSSFWVTVEMEVSAFPSLFNPT